MGVRLILSRHITLQSSLTLSFHGALLCNPLPHYPFTAHYFTILSHISLARHITLQSSLTLSFHGTLLCNPVSHYHFTAHYFAILSHIILPRHITLQSCLTLSFHGTLLCNPVFHGTLLCNPVSHYPFTAHYFAILSHIILSRHITLKASLILSFHAGNFSPK